MVLRLTQLLRRVMMTDVQGNVPMPEDEPVEPAKTPKASKPPKTSDRVRIILEENDDIPPTGLFVSVNGRPYLIRPGEPVDVPQSVVEVLENASYASPQKDTATNQVIGYRERMRFPFRRV